jgi:hypothetical protein
MALKFVERPNVNIRDVNLSVEEWRVVSYINPKNSMRQIARANKLNDLEIRRIVYGLLQAGLVEIIRPEGALPVQTWSSPSVQGREKVEKKSIVNRLIQRIRSL